MSRRGLGLVLVLMFAVAGAGAALFETIRFDQLIAQERAAAESVHHALQSVQISIANLRGAQAAYFAIGQGPDFWPKRASELAADVERQLNELQAATPAGGAAAHYEAALSALGTLNSLDQKARDDLDNGEQRLASEVIFADATTAVSQLTAAISAAQAEEQVFREARVSELRRQRLWIEGGGLGGVVALMFILVAVRRRGPAVEETSQSPVPRIDAPVVPAPAVAPPVPVPATTSRLNLSDAAQVCVDLARVLDGDDVPPLLARAARAIGAKGLVLWVADGSGAMLRPSLAHGYADRIVQRLGPLQVDADNVTSLAFRSMKAQTLAGTAGATSALAVPLITSTGCIGVLAAEVGPQDAGEDTVAVARMFAAQLATLVNPADGAAAKAAQG